jgi:hypothetical protein
LQLVLKEEVDLEIMAPKKIIIDTDPVGTSKKCPSVRTPLISSFKGY